MKIVTIYASIHHGNTKKIAETIHDELGGALFNFTEVEKKDIKEADLIGFGSGIYFSKFHKGLLSFVKDLSLIKKKKVFIFSTSGIKRNIILNRGHRSFKKILEEKRVEIIGEFECLGHDSNGVLKYFGGINKGRPNADDVKKARKFAKKINCNISAQ